jgi:gliding motility-associated-like protein
MKTLTVALSLCLILTCFKTSAQVNLNQGLLAYFPFSGNANDASGQGNHGNAMGGIQLTTDKFGNPNSAYQFDGVDDHIIVFDNGKLSPKRITLVAWVYAENSNAQSITGKIQKNNGFHSTYHIGINYDIQAGFFWGLAPGGSSCNQQIPYNPNNPFVTSPDYFSTNAWHCVVGTFQDSVQKLYVDGVLVKTRKSNFKDLDQCTNTNFLIGRWWDGDPIPFKGKIDEVRVYDRELNQQEINALCDAQPCGNWLNLTSNPAYVQVGDLDVPGNLITVEAMINRTAPYTGGQQWAGDVVSKHNNPTDANYLLRPNGAEITTSNGYFRTPDICEIELNKTYHVAMTYDGASLKFYRNGFLMSQVAATGTLYQNNFNTRIGYYDANVHNTQFIGYINEVRIWNIVRTQTEIQSYMNSALPPSGRSGLLAYYAFDNLQNKQGNAAWNGTLSPAGAAINQANPSCAAFVPDNCMAPPPIKFDFTYKHDVCNPRRVQFTAFGDNLQSPNWSFGDGNINTGSLQPANTYLAFGSYPVIFSVANGLKRDTITKWLTIGIDPADVILTPDTTICSGTGKQLRTKPALSFCWSPTTYLSDPNSPSPIATPPHNITYYFTAENTGTNLIVNGDFSAGNTGFSSDYSYTNPTNVTEGEYNISTNPQTWNPGMSNCRDHTTGNGNMMMVNGSGTLNATVWRQTVTVTPHTNYAFSTWIQSVHPTSPAQLQFSINGQPLGNTINASATPCSWNQFYTTWNSGTNTTAVISVVNRNTGFAGNDFALDDMSFAAVFFQRDSVRIIVETPVVNATNDASFCPGTSVQLNASGAASYSWSPATGLSNAAIANPLATPAGTIKYTVTGTTASGCTAKDSVTLSALPGPTIVKSSDTGICRNSTAQLFASGGVSYSWSPAATLSNPNIANPVASPTGYTVYTVQVTGANNCTNTDSVKVSIRPRPAFTITTDKAICEGKSVTLNASGGDQYSWSPAALVDDPSSPSPVASPGVSTMFTVLARETVCNYDSTLTVNVAVNENPELLVSKSNDIDCTNAYANLLVSGASTYSWSPVTGLDKPTANNPIARVNTTTRYTVTGTNQFGCSSSDTVTVKVSNAGNPIFEVPNAFTPNNDRVNDCFGLRKWARVTELEFIIYNRWGQRVFSTNDPSNCWDGTLNGKPQDSGGFIYTIRAKSACGEVFKKGVVMLIR